MNANGQIFSEFSIVSKRRLVGKVNHARLGACEFVGSFGGAIGTQPELSDIRRQAGFSDERSRNGTIHKSGSILCLTITLSGADPVYTRFGVFVLVAHARQGRAGYLQDAS
jgi:hypothetical protein